MAFLELLPTSTGTRLVSSNPFLAIHEHLGNAVFTENMGISYLFQLQCKRIILTIRRQYIVKLERKASFFTTKNTKEHEVNIKIMLFDCLFSSWFSVSFVV